MEYRPGFHAVSEASNLDPCILSFKRLKGSAVIKLLITWMGVVVCSSHIFFELKRSP